MNCKFKIIGYSVKENNFQKIKKCMDIRREICKAESNGSQLRLGVVNRSRKVKAA